MAQSQTAAASETRPTATRETSAAASESVSAARMIAHMGHVDGQTAERMEYEGNDYDGVVVRNTFEVNARTLRRKFGWQVGSVHSGNTFLIPVHA